MTFGCPFQLELFCNLKRQRPCRARGRTPGFASCTCSFLTLWSPGMEPGNMSACQGRQARKDTLASQAAYSDLGKGFPNLVLILSDVYQTKGTASEIIHIQLASSFQGRSDTWGRFHSPALAQQAFHSPAEKVYLFPYQICLYISILVQNHVKFLSALVFRFLLSLQGYVWLMTFF